LSLSHSNINSHLTALWHRCYVTGGCAKANWLDITMHANSAKLGGQAALTSDLAERCARTTVSDIGINEEMSNNGDEKDSYDPGSNIGSLRQLALWEHQPVTRRRRWAMITLMVAPSIVLIASAMILAYVHVSAHAATLFRKVPSSEPSVKTPVMRQLEVALLQAQIAREASERAHERIGTELARQHEAKDVAEASLREARDQVATERSHRLAAEHDRLDALTRLTMMARQNGLAEIAAREARDLASRERRLRLAAERSRDVVLLRYKAESDAARQLASKGWGSPFTVRW
jgi:hypothetical protein